MRRLLLALLLAVSCTADFSKEDVAKYSRILFDECTLCQVRNVVKQRPEFVKQVASRIPALPNVFRAHAMAAVQQWTKEIVDGPISDCGPACGASAPNSTGCEELVILNGRMSEFLVTMQNDASKECHGHPNEKSCLQQQHSSNNLISAAIKEAVHSLALLVDPQNSCGIDAPTMQHHELAKMYTNGEFLTCQLCYSFLQFLNTVVASGQTETSKTILNALGVAGQKVCVAINLPAILHFLVPALGDLDCNDMPAVIILVFQHVLSPMLGAEAQQTCTALYSYCSDVFNQ